jgi:protein involved in polysaccharide export with SLBB domain
VRLFNAALANTALAVALSLTATATANADTMLHPGDKIEVTVFNHPELSVARTIDASGNVSLPVAGTVTAQNMGSTALAAAVRDRLSVYVRDVAVQVKLDAQTASIFVSGGSNGVVPYHPGMTLASVVAYLNASSPAPKPDAANAQQVATQALVPNATQLDLLNGPLDFRRVTILRDGQPIGPIDLVRLREVGQTGPALQPSDTIQLVDKPVAVTVRGDVERPGIAYLDQAEPLAQALTQVGGPAASSRIDQLQLIRDGATNLVSLGSPEFSQPARNGDQLVVPRAVHVDVLGNVQKPGDTMLRGSNTLVSALYYAGGPAKFANLRAVQVIRGGKKVQYDLAKVQKGAAGDNPQLLDGDIVFVPQGSTFQWSDLWGALGALGLFGVHL